MKRRAVIEEAIGESRAAVFEGKRLVELYSWRWSDKAKPRSGDIFAGRITRIEPSLGAAFVDLGHGENGFLKFSNAPGAPRLTEGRYIHALVTRDAEPGKGPVLKFHDICETTSIGPVKTRTLPEFLSSRFPNIKLDYAAVNSLEGALETQIAIPEGGSISIEKTRALIAIDIDKGSANSGFDVSLAACELIASQIRLRGLGGLIVIDFPNLRQNRQRQKVCEAIEHAFEDDPEVIKIAPISRFGALEMTRSKARLSLDETLMKHNRVEPSDETVALQAVRQLEREGGIHPGAKLTLSVPDAAFDWLESGIIDWRAALTERLGARFTVIRGAAIHVEADR